MPGSLKVAYYLSRFPRLSETFILREMCLLRQTGVDVQVFSIFPPLPASRMHQQVRSMLPFTHYSPWLFSARVLLAQVHFLLHDPGRYLQALGRTFWQTSPEPRTCLIALALFPKAVYFARQLQEMGIEHIHAHFVWLNGVAGQVAADLLGIPLTLHAHAWDIFRRKPECVRRQLVLATAVVTVSDYHQRFLVGLARNSHALDIRIVHYGLDPQEFTPSSPGASHHEPRIISVGRLTEKKGFSYLVEACALLVKKGFDIHCTIVGEGSQNNLQKQIDSLELTDCASLAGAKTISEIQELYRHSDIFALPCIVAQSGDRDGMPNALLEAMAMQLPVITTPLTGNPELVRDGVNGLLVPERDATSLALAIEQLINDPSLRLRLGEQARRTILDGFDIHQTASQMAAIFQELHTSSPTLRSPRSVSG
jgi:colanic acid/amylovoran biosynthesis glycosyltransferase